MQKFEFHLAEDPPLCIPLYNAQITKKLPENKISELKSIQWNFIAWFSQLESLIQD